MAFFGADLGDVVKTTGTNSPCPTTLVIGSRRIQDVRGLPIKYAGNAVVVDHDIIFGCGVGIAPARRAQTKPMTTAYSLQYERLHLEVPGTDLPT